jgi:hypothetical protein
LEEQSEAKGISPTLPKSKVQRIGVFQKFEKTKQNKVKPSKTVQYQSKKEKKKLRFVLEQSEDKEYNGSSTIEDLPLLYR